MRAAAEKQLLDRVSLSLLNDLAGYNDHLFEPWPEPTRTKIIEHTYANLKNLTGQNFAYDVDAWREWMLANPNWWDGKFDSEIDSRFDLFAIFGISREPKNE